MRNKSHQRRGTKRGWNKPALLADRRIEPEAERCREVLRTILRLLGVPIREIERRTGVTHSYWNNIFAGRFELTLTRLLAFAYALEIEPAELVRLLYPLRPQSPSPGALLLSEAGVQLGAVVQRVVLDLSISQTERWARCAGECGYASTEEWVTAAAEAEVLRQRAQGLEEIR